MKYIILLYIIKQEGRIMKKVSNLSR
ncbi:TPA: XRE family transcriptional regulator, partial [Enterococcus faecalis]